MTLGSIPKRKALAVRRALEPDNTGFPPGLSLDVRVAGGGLVLDFRSAGGGMGRLAGTVDEVLEHVQVALGVVG